MICLNPISIRKKVVGKSNNGDRVSVPCGKCSACLSNRRNDWIIRLTEELKQHDCAAFLTLTYSDENLTFGYKSPTLVKEDLQKFIKLLRYYVNRPLRYYAVGEYGTKTKRPHYHLIVFNLHHINDIDNVQKAWTKGHSLVGDVNIRSISYVAKYHVNKVDNVEGEQKSFCCMSLKTPIGIAYVEKKKSFTLIN